MATDKQLNKKRKSYSFVDSFESIHLTGKMSNLCFVFGRCRISVVTVVKLVQTCQFQWQTGEHNEIGNAFTDNTLSP